MKRIEYFGTIKGQSYLRFKRKVKTLYFEVDQEPKSKTSISDKEKTYFRNEIRRQLKEKNRRAYRGDIILQIDYYTTQDNPPALHTLSKNYMDLLHKALPNIDNFEGLLFGDDSQVKILISNYHLNDLGSHKPKIAIKSYSLSDFYKDVELSEKILENKFLNSDNKNIMLEDESRCEDFYRERDMFQDLKHLRKEKDFYVNKYGESFFKSQEHFHIRKLQERYFKINGLNIRDLIAIFKSKFSSNKRYGNFGFQSLWSSNRKLIFFTYDFQEIGNAPAIKGETTAFKGNLKKRLNEFKIQYKILFPLLQPISLLITFIPPRCNVVDSDNLARYIVPFVNEIFNPPATLRLSYERKHLDDLLKEEVLFKQKFYPNSIASYQLIHIPRDDNDPEYGEIRFVITDGLNTFRNIWNIVDETIEKWSRITRDT